MSLYEAWRQNRLAERRSSSTAQRAAWNHLITVVVHGADGADAEALSRTLDTLFDQTYRNIEILVAGAGEGDLSDRHHFTGLRGLFVEPALHPLDVLSKPAADTLWRGSHLVFAAVGTTFDADAFALLNQAISPRRGATQPDLVVCDHDRAARPGAASESCFLPGWDPDLITEMDYIGGAFMVSRKLVLDRRGEEPPACLHDWLRALATDTRPIVAAHVTETVIHLVAGPIRPAGARGKLSSAGRLRSAIIIPNRDRPELLARCVRVLDFFQGPVPALVIVDHASVDPATLALYGELERRYNARIERVGGQFNFSRMINIGVAATSAEILLLLNNDIEVTTSGELESIVEHAARPEVGVVGAHLRYPDGRVQHAGMILRPSPDRLRHPVMAEHVLRGAESDAAGYLHALSTVRNYQAVTGALIATRRDVFDAAGGFDEVNLPVEYNDVDYCLRVRAMGLRVIALPTRGIVHRESSTRGTEHTPEVLRMRSKSMAIIADRWEEAVNNDPFRNPWAQLGEVSDARFPWTNASAGS